MALLQNKSLFQVLRVIFPNPGLSLPSVPRPDVRAPWSNVNVGHMERSNFTAVGEYSRKYGWI